MLLRVLSLALIGVAQSLPMAFANVPNLAAQLDGDVKNPSIETPSYATSEGNAVVWQAEVNYPKNSEYVRLYIELSEIPEAGNMILELRGKDGQVWRYSAKDFRKKNPLPTNAVFGDYAMLSLSVDQVPAKFKLRVVEITFQADAGGVLSPWGADEREPIAKYAADAVISSVERSVARLLFKSDGAPRVCTGFLLDDNRLMTNHHCVASQAVCDGVIALFGYQYGVDGKLNLGEQFECVRVLQSNYIFDYTVLELQGAPGQKWGQLELGKEDPRIISPVQPLFIVQHGAGKVKEISIIDCQPLAMPVDGRSLQTDFSHTCDTLPGSSGSPVFDKAGRVIGLHHYGFGDGQPGDWSENRAVRITKILTDLGK